MELLNALADRIAYVQKRASKRVGFLVGPGHGDARRGIAIAAALARGMKSFHRTILFHYTGDEAMVEFDSLAAARAANLCDAYVPYDGDVLDHSTLLTLSRQFDVLYDCMPYAPSIVGRVGIGPFHRLSDHYPDENGLLKRIPLSVWDIAGLLLGTPVRPSYAPMPSFPAPFPTAEELAHLMLPEQRVKLLHANAGSDDPKLAKVDAARYVVIHNAAGRHARSKVAPMQVMQAIRTVLAADGVQCVQVGSAQAPLVDGAIDRRGTRVAITAHILKGAVACVSNEGYIPILAASCRTLAYVLFGPTPAHTFLCPGHTAIVSPKCPLPYQSCYSGVQDAQIYIPEAGWSEECPLGKQSNPGRPDCLNFPTPAEAAERVRAHVTEILALREAVPCPGGKA
jgi:hypothetical protein